MGVVIESDRWAAAEVMPSLAGPAVAPAPVLALEGVSAAQGRRAVLHDVSLAAGASDVVAVLGANGSGRTTASQVLAGELAPTSGRVHRPDELGVVVSEQPVFPTLSVRDHLRLGGADPRAGYARFPELEEMQR